MSKRPTTNSRKECSNAHLSTNTYGYAIIGDTVSSTLYAKRLLGNNVTTPITLINEGVDRTNLNKLTDTSFVADNNKRILHHLNMEQLHMIPAGDNQTEKDDHVDSQTDHIILHHIGAGPLSDFIGAYHIPRLGPWFQHTSNNRLEKFLIDSTVKFPLNTQELAVSNSLMKLWNLKSTSSLMVREPSILNCHYEFVLEQNDSFTRELFLDVYHNNNQAANIDHAAEVNNLKFDRTSDMPAGLYNITASNLSLKSVRPIWRTNPFTYLRLATEGGLDAGSLLIPTFYRAVMPIPLVNGVNGVDLSNLNDHGDMVTTHIAFSLNDVGNPKNSSLAWLVQCYTTREDLSVVDPSGKYADTGKTFLVVEAVCPKNKRVAIYDKAEHEIQINYNDRITEHGYLKQFAQIAAGVYNAYTGVTISVDTLLADASVCSTNGTCQDGNTVVDYSLRESPMVSILNLASQMYGLDLYPTPGKC